MIADPKSTGVGWKLILGLVAMTVLLQLAIVMIFSLWLMQDVRDSTSSYADVVQWAHTGGYEALLVVPPLVVLVVGLVALQLRRRWVLVITWASMVLIGVGGPIVVMTTVPVPV